MKKICFSIVAILLVCLFLCSCGSKNVDLNQIMNKINDEYGISNVTVIDDAAKLKRYYEIDDSLVKQFAVEYAKDASTYCEVVLVEAVDSDAAEKIETSLQNHLQSKISESKSYSPESLAMLEACEVYKSGNFVALIIDAQAASIEDVLKEALS